MSWQRPRSRKPSPQYSRVFSALFFGAWLFIAGTAGYDVKGMNGIFRGIQWQDSPVWWQMALGLGLLGLGIYWFRRLPDGNWTIVTRQRGRPIKNVGRGRTADVEHEGQARLPADRM